MLGGIRDLRPHHGWVLYLRGRRIGWYYAATMLVTGIGLVAPREVPVVLRDVSADPWQLLWTLPGCFVGGCLAFDFDRMEAALPMRPWTLRAAVVVAVLVGTAAGVAVSSILTQRGLAGALLSALATLGAAFVLATLLGPGVSVFVVFAAVLATWVFGISDTEMRVHGWAVLLATPRPATVVIGIGLCSVGSALWVTRGSRRSIAHSD